MALNSEISTDDLKKIMESIKTTPAAYVDDVAWLADAKKRFNSLPDGEERKNALGRWASMLQAIVEERHAGGNSSGANRRAVVVADGTRTGDTSARLC